MVWVFFSPRILTFLLTKAAEIIPGVLTELVQELDEFLLFILHKTSCSSITGMCPSSSRALGRRGLFKNLKDVVITLKPLILKVTFWLCQVEDSSLALTPLFSVITTVTCSK